MSNGSNGVIALIVIILILGAGISPTILWYQGEDLRQKNEQLLVSQEVITQLQVELKKYRGEIDGLHTQLDQAKIDLDLAREQVAVLGEKIQAAEQAVADLTQQLSAAQQTNTALTDALNKAKAELESANAQVAQMSEQNRAAGDQVAAMEAEVKAVEVKLDQTEKERDEALLKIQVLEASVEKARISSDSCQIAASGFQIPTNECMKDLIATYVPVTGGLLVAMLVSHTLISRKKQPVWMAAHGDQPRAAEQMDPDVVQIRVPRSKVDSVVRTLRSK
jgi:hypothetical protein